MKVYGIITIFCIIGKILKSAVGIIDFGLMLSQRIQNLIRGGGATAGTNQQRTKYDGQPLFHGIFLPYRIASRRIYADSISHLPACRSCVLCVWQALARDRRRDCSFLVARLRRSDNTWSPTVEDTFWQPPNRSRSAPCRTQRHS